MPKTHSTAESAIDAGYSRAFLAAYGRKLSRIELRLVQGYRALNRSEKAELLQLVSTWVLQPGERPTINRDFGASCRGASTADEAGARCAMNGLHVVKFKRTRPLTSTQRLARVMSRLSPAEVQYWNAWIEGIADAIEARRRELKRQNIGKPVIDLTGDDREGA